MSDRLFFSLAAVVTVFLIALATMWPQGLGARSPRPFGHITVAEQAQRDLAAGKGHAPPTAVKAKLKGAF